MWILSSSNWAQVTEHLRPGKTSGGTPEPEPEKPKHRATHFYSLDDKSVATAAHSTGHSGDFAQVWRTEVTWRRDQPT